MVHFCGQCGNNLTATVIRDGRCPQCGAAIEYSGDTLGLDAAPPGDTPTYLLGRASAPFPAADVAGTRTSFTDAVPAQQPAERGWQDTSGSLGTLQRGASVTRPQAPRRTRWALALFLAVPLVLVGTSVLLLTQTGALAALAPNASSHSGATSSATASASAAGAASTSATSTAAAVSHAPTQPPVPGASPSVTAAPSPTASASPQGSPVPGPAYLSVSPKSITFVLCIPAQTAHFTVANTGGTTMQWSASASPNGYVIVPSSGTVDAGGNQSVTVNKISGPGTVTVSASNAANSPQKVTVTCLP